MLRREKYGNLQVVKGKGAEKRTRANKNGGTQVGDSIYRSEPAALAQNFEICTIAGLPGGLQH